MRLPDGRYLLGFVALLTAVGCSSSTEPPLGPVDVRVTVASVSPNALLPVRLRTLDGGDWFVNLCGYRFEILRDGEWWRPTPLPPACSEQPNVASQAGEGTLLEVRVPENYPPATYRIVFVVNPGGPMDKALRPLAEQVLVGSNRFTVLPLF